MATFARKTKRASNTFWFGTVAIVFAAMGLHPLALIGIALLPLLGFAVRGKEPDEVKNIGPRLSAAQERVNAVIREIEREKRTSALPALQARAEVLYRGLGQFPQRRVERLRVLEQGRRDRQLHRFLDQFDVDKARLKNFGPGLYATLVSHGVETADDVSAQKLAGIWGFGPKRIAALLDWRRSIEARFKFNDADPADSQERVRVERELQLEHAKEVTELRRLSEQIKATAVPMRQRVVTLTDELRNAQRDLADLQSMADAVKRLL